MHNFNFNPVESLKNMSDT